MWNTFSKIIRHLEVEKFGKYSHTTEEQLNLAVLVVQIISLVLYATR